ncbi:hypothetical protein BC008_21330 [Mastigocoleus testarum BC008]|uniref:Peptidoglycan binding-like domain-containing protein n=1 Tax=Mastigocoleus testarum BC008 TaxID=371196 RepID=A0A0V7ZLK8_9CYAN|nr:hypothetical protein BC008_21330 [Mastigocoleus testarum BC008]
MWCGIRRSTSARIATICLFVTGIVTSNTALALRERNYTPEEFCGVLRGLGYEVEISNTCLQDSQTKKAVGEFQQGYKLGVESVTGAKTQNHAASIVKILQTNLNMIVKPEPPLPVNQFYGPQTAAAVKKYQEKLKIEQTGIADLALRQRLDKKVKEMLDTPESGATTTPSSEVTTPKSGETTTPSPEATTTPKPGATTTPSSEVTTPKSGETTTPSPEATTTPTPEATTPKSGETATPNPGATTPSSGETTTPNPGATTTPTPEATSTPSPEATSTPTPEATSTPSPTPKPKPE